MLKAALLTGAMVISFDVTGSSMVEFHVAVIGFNVRNCDFQSSINVSLSCVFLCLSLVITGELFVIIRVFRRGFLFLFLSRRREEREEGGGWIKWETLATFSSFQRWRNRLRVVSAV